MHGVAGSRSAAAHRHHHRDGHHSVRRAEAAHARELPAVRPPLSSHQQGLASNLAVRSARVRAKVGVLAKFSLLDMATGEALPSSSTGLLGCWVAGLLGCWVAGVLGCWVAAAAYPLPRRLSVSGCQPLELVLPEI
jgi:uncharacterized membrane protein